MHFLQIIDIEAYTGFDDVCAFDSFTIYDGTYKLPVKHSRLHNIPLPNTRKCKHFAPFLYASDVAQYMLHGVLCKPVAYRTEYSMCL